MCIHDDALQPYATAITKAPERRADTTLNNVVFRPLPRRITQPIFAVLIAWVAVMALVVNRSYLKASSATLATDLARYGLAAEWRGVYYRGEKIGFTVSQMVAKSDGFELQEDGRLQMSLSARRPPRPSGRERRSTRTSRSERFSSPWIPAPGRRSERRADGTRLALSVTTAGETRTEIRELPEPPALSLNLSRRLANGGLVPGAPSMDGVRSATLQTRLWSSTSASASSSGSRRQADSRVPCRNGVLRAADDVVGHRHRRGRERGKPARPHHGSRTGGHRARHGRVQRIQSDLLEAAAIVPITKERIDEPRDVRACASSSKARTCRRPIWMAGARPSSTPRATSSKPRSAVTAPDAGRSRGGPIRRA